MAKIRKAVVAGCLAAAGTAVGALRVEVPAGEAAWSALVSSALAAGILAGLATWRIPNAPPAQQQ